jgi:hypothetical protein
VSEAVLAAVRRAVGGGATDHGEATKAAQDTLALARELGIDPDLDRAQEVVYDTVRSSDRPDLADLAESLGLSPALFEARPEEGVQASA